MTEKEILTELKMCYEYLGDIEINHDEQLTEEEVENIWKIQCMIDSIYHSVWTRTEYKEDLIYKEDKDDLILIGDYASADYVIQDKRTKELKDYLTCGYEIENYWYYEELGFKHGDWHYEIVSKGFLRALKELESISKQNGKDFNYFKKANELLKTNNPSVLDLINEYEKMR